MGKMRQLNILLFCKCCQKIMRADGPVCAAGLNNGCFLLSFFMKARAGCAGGDIINDYTVIHENQGSRWQKLHAWCKTGRYTTTSWQFTRQGKEGIFSIHSGDDGTAR